MKPKNCLEGRDTLYFGRFHPRRRARVWFSCHHMQSRMIGRRGDLNKSFLTTDHAPVLFRHACISCGITSGRNLREMRRSTVPFHCHVPRSLFWCRVKIQQLKFATPDVTRRICCTSIGPDSKPAQNSNMCRLQRVSLHINCLCSETFA